MDLKELDAALAAKSHVVNDSHSLFFDADPEGWKPHWPENIHGTKHYSSQERLDYLTVKSAISDFLTEEFELALPAALAKRMGITTLTMADRYITSRPTTFRATTVPGKSNALRPKGMIDRLAKVRDLVSKRPLAPEGAWEYTVTMNNGLEPFSWSGAAGCDEDALELALTALLAGQILLGHTYGLKLAQVTQISRRTDRIDIDAAKARLAPLVP